MLKTTTLTPKKSQVSPRWVLVDLKDQVLGRAASKIASILLGKEKSEFAPNLALGDFVVAINSKDFRITGKKETKKRYYRYSGYPGGLKSQSLRELKEKNSVEIINRAVWGMLPKNRLGKKLMSRLYVYSSKDHPHTAQKPEEVKI